MKEWSEQVYPTICGSREGKCPKCGLDSLIAPHSLLGEINNHHAVITECCRICGRFWKV